MVHWKSGFSHGHSSLQVMAYVLAYALIMWWRTIGSHGGFPNEERLSLFFIFFSLIFLFFLFWEDWWIEWLLFYIGKRSLLALSNLNWLIGCENYAKFGLVKFFACIYHPGYALFGESRFVWCLSCNMCNLHPYNKYKH